MKFPTEGFYAIRYYSPILDSKDENLLGSKWQGCHTDSFVEIEIAIQRPCNVAG